MESTVITALYCIVTVGSSTMCRTRTLKWTCCWVSVVLFSSSYLRYYAYFWCIEFHTCFRNPSTDKRNVGRY